jgi:hypothetical protein
MQFLHHPLFAVLRAPPGDPPVLACRCRVPDADQFLVDRSFKTALTSVDPDLQRSLIERSGFNLLRWLVRRCISVHESHAVLLDLEAQRLHPVDLVGERDGRLTLVFVYFSKQRGGGQWDAMMANGARMKGLVARQYRLDADVVVANFYGSGQVRGAWVEGS